MAAASPSVPSASKGPSAVRVIVVDDSAVIRGLITRWLDEDSEITVVGSASNGRQGLQMAAQYKPDVVILDIEMPEMDGLTALPEIIKAVPHAKVVMASTLTRRNAEISLRALSLGAADYVPKPEATRTMTASADFRTEICAKVKALGKAARRNAPKLDARAEAGMARRETRPAAPAPAQISLREASRVKPQILAIGSSTGGPQALFELIKGIAPQIDVPIVITQHMPPTFTSILAEHLAKVSGLVCGEGRSGEVLSPCQVYVAPGDRHMLLEKQGTQTRIVLSDAPQENFCRPAVDPMFRSIAAIYGPAALCTVLTGMGSDGREGARKIVGAGGTVIAQDEATSVVWGMPGAVALAGLCAGVYPISRLASEILKLMGKAQ